MGNKKKVGKGFRVETKKLHGKFSKLPEVFSTKRAARQFIDVTKPYAVQGLVFRIVPVEEEKAKRKGKAEVEAALEPTPKARREAEQKWLVPQSIRIGAKAIRITPKTPKLRR